MLFVEVSGYHPLTFRIVPRTGPERRERPDNLSAPRPYMRTRPASAKKFYHPVLTRKVKEVFEPRERPQAMHVFGRLDCST